MTARNSTLSGKRVAISQVFIYNLDVVDDIEADFLKYMEDENKARRFDLRLMVFTNIEGKGSRFIYTGKLSNFFMGTIKDFEKQGVVSRKKQISTSTFNGVSMIWKLKRDF